MLPRKNRISRNDFPSYNAKGFRVFSPLFSAVFYTKTTQDGQVSQQASVVVSKKTAKTAVLRNYLRRRFYDLLNPYFKDISTSFTVVFYPKIEAKNSSQEILNKEIEKALKGAKLLK